MGVYASDGTFLACGHYQIGSIAVRILSFDSDVLKPDFWKTMLSRALEERKALGLSGQSRTTCYRLVHGEGDNLPGLIIDWYDGVCVMQAHSAGMFRSRLQITDALKEVYGDELKAVYDKSSGTAPFKAGLDLVDGYTYRKEGFSDDSQTVLEYGHRFLVNWTDGQKTGFFLDQRENRHLVEKYAAGRNVLNLFCYTGGFSVYALCGGASHVDSVDSSRRAMELVDKNIVLNGFSAGQHEGFCCDAIDFLKNVPEGKYDMMILDPPKLAKTKSALDNAMKAYKDLNRVAMMKIRNGGIIATYSCSGAMTREDFKMMLGWASTDAGCEIQILRTLSAGEDHPVRLSFPESEYLKGFLIRVIK